MSGVALAPLPVTVPVLLATGIGTALCSASAATFNQMSEAPFDAQMTRTRSRPLVSRIVTPLHAAGFGLVTGIAGPVILFTMVNPLTAALGAFNIFLYAGVYTWMKRRTVVNTWVGSVVGAIPPLMGWTACEGQFIPSLDYTPTWFLPPFLTDVTPALELINNPMSAFALFMISFSWQFPHFNSLAHLTRAQYAKGGYQMLSVTNPSHNALVSLRHTLLLFPLCSLLTPLSGLTTWWFALTSLAPNGILLQSAWKYWRMGSDGEARKTFYHSLWHLPAIMVLMMAHKQGTEWTDWFGLKSKKEEVAEK
jgi:protoheme IX farnesyltransferase